jgi:hypothetical protein
MMHRGTERSSIFGCPNGNPNNPTDFLRRVPVRACTRSGTASIRLDARPLSYVPARSDEALLKIGLGLGGAQRRKRDGIQNMDAIPLSYSSEYKSL